MSVLETLPEPPEGGVEIGSRAFLVRQAKAIMMVRVYTVGDNRAVVIARKENTNATIERTETIKQAVMGTAWTFSLVRDYTLRSSTYNGISGEAIFQKTERRLWNHEDLDF